MLPTTDRLSIIVPFYNEEDNVAELLREIRQACPAAD
jgi:dolichol-phosphate mannosyltransferase